MANLTYNPDGTTNVNFEQIQKISIDNLVQMISHRVMRLEEYTVHDIEFVNGGKCQLSYTSSGQLRNFTTTNLTIEINLEQDILVLKAL